MPSTSSFSVSSDIEADTVENHLPTAEGDTPAAPSGLGKCDNTLEETAEAVEIEEEEEGEAETPGASTGCEKCQLWEERMKALQK